MTRDQRSIQKAVGSQSSQPQLQVKIVNGFVVVIIHSIQAAGTGQFSFSLQHTFIVSRRVGSDHRGVISIAFIESLSVADRTEATGDVGACVGTSCQSVNFKVCQISSEY